MAIPTYVGAGAFDGAINGVTAAWPTHQADDIGILLIENTQTDTDPSTPAGWTEFTGSPVVAGTVTRLSAFWKRAASGAESNVSVPDLGDHQGTRLFVVRGCITTGDPFDITVTDAASGTTASINGGTTTVADCLICVCLAWASDNAGPFTSAWSNADLANLTEQFDEGTTAGNGGGLALATGEKASAGAFGATDATLAVNTGWAAIVLAMKPPAGGGGGVTGRLVGGSLVNRGITFGRLV